ncbi:MAG: ribosome silencing factor [bacterium]|nr:ribosome silencing factor [bacterium]
MNEETNNRHEESVTPQTIGATASSGARILDQETAKAFAVRAAQSLQDDRCTDVVVLDVTGVSPVTGFIVIGSGTSARQMRSSLENVNDLAKEVGTKAYAISSDERAMWLLADFVDVVIHLFEPNARAHYDLESLWSNSTRVEVPPSERKRPGIAE